jgi:hypothetical protein
MIRGFTLIAVISPNVLGLETSPAGLAKFGHLKTLNTSQRNTRLAFPPSLGALDESHVDVALVKPPENVPLEIPKGRPACVAG